MIQSDLLYVFQWWLMWFSLGIIFLPLTSKIFDSFRDKGYIFAKILGILLISFSIWILSSIKLVPFTLLPLLVLIGIFLIISVYLTSQEKVARGIKLSLKIILLEEFLFFAGLIFWSWIKGFEPSIHGLEKYMDFGFINSILRSEYFPPKDLWLTPHSINYYYFGHLIAAVTTKLSGIDPVISYNLILATIFALTFSASFSISMNLFSSFVSQQQKLISYRPLRREASLSLISGFLGAFLVTFGGNLHTIYILFQSYIPAENPIPFWQLPLKLNLDGYWYPNATRFIPFTIHEFPIYSFVVSDLHGHVLNIPVVLFTLALLIKIFHSPKIHITHYTLLALLMAISLMSNVLDGPIYLLVIFFVFLFRKIFQEETKLRAQTIVDSAKNTATVALGAVLFSLPFWLTFKPFASGIGVLCAPSFLTNLGKLGPFLFEPNHCARSPIWMLIILWGFFFLVVSGFLFFTLKELRSLKFLNLTDGLVLTFTLAATLLIVIPEFFYAKDIYPAHYRANTVFKFGYQAFIILGLICGYIMTRILSLPHKTIRYTLYAIPLAFLFFLVAIYPFFAINSYFGGLKNYQGLDGLSYLNNLYAADYRAILWIRGNISGQPVILEAQGDSYTDYARISSNTGLPTVIGWTVHEWLWRGSFDEAGKRSNEVTELYESTDIEMTKQLIQRYNIEYIFIGSLERQKYLKLNEAKFATLGKVIFQDGQTTIYQLYR